MCPFTGSTRSPHPAGPRVRDLRREIAQPVGDLHARNACDFPAGVRRWPYIRNGRDRMYAVFTEVNATEAHVEARGRY